MLTGACHCGGSGVRGGVAIIIVSCRSSQHHIICSYAGGIDSGSVEAFFGNLY